MMTYLTKFLSWLWPIRTGNTFVDLWSLVHLCFWVVVGANFQSLRWKHPNLPVWSAFAGTVLFAYVWEVFEKFYCEPHGMVRHPEVWFNRWLSDPLVGVLGVAIGMLLILHE